MSSFDFVPPWRIDAKKMADEEVEALVLAKLVTEGVVSTRQDDEVEVASSALQGCGQLERGGRVDVVVKLSNDEHERPREPWSHPYIGGAHIAGVDGPPHPLLVPPDFVHAIVMAAASTIGCLIEVAMLKHGGRSLLSAGRGSKDAHTRRVDIWIALGGGPDPSHAVGESGILQVLVADLLEALAAIARAHGIELHHDKAEFG